MTSGFNIETREKILEANRGYCCVKGCLNRAIEFHHAIHNTNINSKKFPLLLNSVFNCKPCCRFHHDNYSKYPELNITEAQAEVYEKWLNELIKKGKDNEQKDNSN